ncbi:hypothetical protein MA16_Dca000274 [Dendrobium catenatum]|uniref:Uncharacterized protein n=1 Tax=Dendrobium catenatum TaxID=906689 RepID=A0A2I0WTE4_9ASPA|nr:hypothetical protein MA16_Dca000274 [Dendrobium catenatum]
MDQLPVMMVGGNMDRMERHVSDLERSSEDSSREEGSDQGRGQGSMEVQQQVDLTDPDPTLGNAAGSWKVVAVVVLVDLVELKFLIYVGMYKEVGGAIRSWACHDIFWTDAYIMLILLSNLALVDLRLSKYAFMANNGIEDAVSSKTEFFTKPIRPLISSFHPVKALDDVTVDNLEFKYSLLLEGIEEAVIEAFPVKSLDAETMDYSEFKHSCLLERIEEYVSEGITESALTSVKPVKAPNDMEVSNGSSTLEISEIVTPSSEVNLNFKKPVLVKGKSTSIKLDHSSCSKQKLFKELQALGPVEDFSRRRMTYLSTKKFVRGYSHH